LKNNDAPVPRRTILSRFLSAIEKIGNALPHPATLFAIFAAILVLLSWLLSKLGVMAVSPIDGVEARAVNLISREGLHWILEHTIGNFTGSPRWVRSWWPCSGSAWPRRAA
jgi:aminobenzoyl-glutamate transport protein